MYLVIPFKQVGDTVEYPEEIKTLLDREFAFKIFVSGFNLNNKYDVYGVTKISDDPTIISHLKKKLYVGQVHIRIPFHITQQILFM